LRRVFAELVEFAGGFGDGRGEQVERGGQGDDGEFEALGDVLGLAAADGELDGALHLWGSMRGAKQTQSNSRIDHDGRKDDIGGETGKAAATEGDGGDCDL
jgi:hypothetical protein